MSLKVIYEIYMAGMSLAAFLLYGSDKLRAAKHRWRIPERVLLGAGLLGGAAGALLGMRLFHHKTRRWYFWTVNAAGLLLQITLLLYLQK